MPADAGTPFEEVLFPPVYRGEIEAQSQEGARDPDPPPTQGNGGVREGRRTPTEPGWAPRPATRW